MHIKKNEMPTTWPLPRKGRGKRFIAVPSHATGKGISVLFILRDVLKIARSRKEVFHCIYINFGAFFFGLRNFLSSID